jgi:hypothetical protein
MDKGSSRTWAVVFEHSLGHQLYGYLSPHHMWKEEEWRVPGMLSGLSGSVLVPKHSRRYDMLFMKADKWAQWLFIDREQVNKDIRIDR